MANAAIEALRQQPQEYDFFWAVRLLQAQFPQSPRIGHSRLLQQDPIRFGQKPSLGFVAASIESLEDGEPPKLNLTSFGLFGPSGPMPIRLTEYALLPEAGLLPFADVFHHRLFSLFYRAWESSQKAADLDRAPGRARDADPERARQPISAKEFSTQRFSRYLASLFGFGLASLQHHDAVPDDARLYYSGQLVPQWRNAEGLEAILRDFFALPVQLEEFVGRWIGIPPEDHCRLGSPTGLLGQNAIAGKSFWDRRMSFTIRLGPLSLDDFLKFLPGRSAFERLRAWVRDYAGQEFIWDLQLVLKAEEVPGIRLKVEERVPEVALGRSGQRLGWTSFLRIEGVPFAHDSEAVFIEDVDS